ncbi:MlaA family lipoprotein [Alteromonas gilva]|uniref:VacJ family lipoprotein n=1 Tax=Alteromonas gilva TaxID=2987522 RepID=A0ABT5L6H6_9ALTE|nr:VacJ family lipoprotein [Alteromonas gilva]MDC8832670.1 VacJ family lipoprotein [Alteromonas gilva]
MTIFTRRLAFVIFSIGLSVLTGCASNSAKEQASANDAAQQTGYSDPRDPLEPVNRLVWDFNWEVLDKLLLRPVTKAYVTVVPGFARTGLSNAVENLAEPSYVVNNLLQGKIGPSFDSFTRFAINSTVGVVGLFDVAGAMGLQRQEEEFGEVLGKWGVGTGPFLMLPARGPNDPRTFTGDVVDNLYFPMTLMTGNLNVLRFTVGALESRAQLLGQEGQIENAVDDYQQVKNIYFQNLEFRVTDGKNLDSQPDEKESEDFEEFDSMFDDIDLDAETSDGN